MRKGIHSLVWNMTRRCAAHWNWPVRPQPLVTYRLVLDAAGQIVGRGYNTREADGDPLAHAEIIAMRQAAQALGAWNLADCTLAVTLEPCPMCAGACIQTHIGTIAFGAWDPKLGACGSIWDIPRDPHIGHSPEVHGGVLEGECQSILTDFFAQRR